MPRPTIGRIVRYTLSEADAALIATDRSARFDTVQLRYNQVAADDVYPATVVRDFGGDAVNLQVHLDGTDTYWATSRTPGDGPGHWAWPPRQGSVIETVPGEQVTR